MSHALIACLVIAVLGSCVAQNHSQNYCINASSLVYTYEGEPSIVGTFVECLRTVQDAMIAPYYDTGIRINVSTEVFLNNLINVDEVSSTVTLDFFFNTIWDDHRFLMPALWSAMKNPESYEVGVDISEASLISNVQGVQPLIWVPDIVFPDAISTVRSEQYLKIYPNGQIRHMEHLVMTFSQSNMYYQDYPCDSQNITIRFFSFTLTSNQLIFTPIHSDNGLITPPVDYIYPQGSNNPSFAQNPEWTLESTDYSYITWQISPGFFPRPFGIVSFKLSRKSAGILQRLCMPILLIMLLCALSWWGTVSERVATTVTGLLAIAALYIAVIGAIPLVGYLTRLDEYMFIMFVIIFVNTIFHMIVVRLNVAEKGQNWPLRKLVVRVIEFVGRVTMIPWIILTYVVCFWPSVRIGVVVSVCVLIGLFEYGMLVRYIPELKHTFYSTKVQIELKQGAKGKRAQGLSPLEKRFLALYREGSVGADGSRNGRTSKEGGSVDTVRDTVVGVELQDTSVNPMNNKP